MSNCSIAPYFPFMRMKITDQTVHSQASAALIKLAPDLRYRPLCHHCEQAVATVHSQGHRRMIRDLDLAGTQVWLQVDYRRIWCRSCDGARVEQLSFCDTGKRVTHRLARYVHDLCKVLTVKDVAKHLDLDPKTVKDIDRTFLEEEFAHSDYQDLRVLALDEISLLKGHYYMTVVLDYFSGRVVWMGEHRNMQTLDNFFAGMTDQQKASIEAVAMDMWEPYINRIQHHCPQAKIVFDFFHVVQSFSKVIDEIRREEYLKAEAQERQVLKGSRYLLLKNEENLSDRQAERLQEVLALNATLNTVYVLKDQLKLLYYYSDRNKVKRALDDWCAMAEQVGHPAMRRFIRRLHFFEYGILNHADYPIGTSMLEGVNNKIKLIKRKAYGFHDTEYFTLKVKQAFPGLN